MKKRLSMLVALGIVLSMLAGCSSSGTESESEATESATTESATEEVSSGSSSDTIEFMTGTAIDTALYTEYENMVAAFAEEYPDAPEIELVPSSTDHEGEVKTRLAGGNAPDMWMTHGWSLGRYSEYCVDLSGESWADDVSPLLEDIMFSEDGEIYALPIDVDLSGIIYNEDVLNSVGYSAEDIKTWDDFTEVCDALTADGQTAIYNAGKDRWPTGLYIDWIVPTIFTDEDYQNMVDGVFATDAYEEVLLMVEDFTASGYFNADYSSATADDVSRAIAQGDAAFSFLMNYVLVTSYEYNPDGNLGFMAIPNEEGSDPYYVVGEKDAIGISIDSEHIDTCLLFLEFLAEPDNLAALATSAGQMTGLTTATADLGALADSYAVSNDYTGVAYFDRVYCPSGTWDAMVTTTEMIVTEQNTVEEALAQMEKEYYALIEE